MPAQFINFEGIDGCGKGTQVMRSMSWLQELGHNTKLIKEPNSDNDMGRHIRAVLEGRAPNPGDFELQRRFVVDRYCDVIWKIGPFLKNENGFLFMDRYAHSTIAYIPPPYKPLSILSLHWEIIGRDNMIWPDVTYFVDITVEEALRRIKSGRKANELYENLPRLEMARRNYHELAQRMDVGKMVVIDGMQDENKVFEQIKEDLQKRFLNNK